MLISFCGGLSFLTDLLVEVFPFRVQFSAKVNATVFFQPSIPRLQGRSL